MGRRSHGPRYLKRDANLRPIMEFLRQIPALTFWDTSDVGGGFPDLAVGFRAATYLFELKAPGKGKDLTRDEWRFGVGWAGHCMIVESAAQIAAAVGLPEAFVRSFQEVEGAPVETWPYPRIAARVRPGGG